MKDIKKKFFKKELRKVFILYALIPIIILSFMFYNLLFWCIKLVIQKHNEKYNNSIADVLTEEFTSYKEEAEKLAEWYEIKKAFYGDYNETLIYETLYNIVNKRTIRSMFYIYNSKGEVVATNSNSIPEYSKSNDVFIWGIFKKMRNNPKDTVMMLNRAQLDVNTRTVYSIGKPVLDEDNKAIGYIVFDILENQLNQVVNSNTSHHVVITDRYGNNIVTSNIALVDSIGKIKIPSQAKEGVVLSKSILYGNVYVHTITSLGFVNNIYIIGEVFLIIVFAVLFIMMSVIAGRIAKSKTTAIDQLLSAIKDVKEGNLDTKVTINTNDEFEVIGDHYNEMLVKIKELMEKNKEEATRSILSELKQLEAQFNPHFLFNTLEMLKYMVKSDPNSSLKVIVAMSNLLRYSINNKYRNVALSDDLKYIEDYLSIQKYRFDDKFDYSITLQPGTENCIIPKLIIQPIIENSIKYGFETKSYLRVDINCRIDGENLIIDIEDNGEGIEVERLLEILTGLSGNDNDTSHIGLYNVHKRIKLMYGEGYGLKIYSKKSQGTRVSITLPL